MNIVNLRKVGNFEIPDSYRGILRISPNLLEDDPTSLLLTAGAEIHLSDSVGNQLPITFVPQKAKTYVDGRLGECDLINITLNVDKLYVSNELNIRQTLYIVPEKNQPPLIFTTGAETVGYPLEAPDDDLYFNKDNKFNFNKNKSWISNIETIAPTDKIYKDDTNLVKINGNYLYNFIRYNGRYYKLPVIKKRDYAMGIRVADRYKFEDRVDAIHNLEKVEYKTDGIYNQLSFLPIESLIYSNLEAELRGLSRASIKGRYNGLNVVGHPSESNNSSNDLFKELFGDDPNDEAIVEQNAPIIGVPVQSGTIHYNAMPARRYFFHLSRRYDEEAKNEYIIDAGNTITEANPTLNHSINSITKHYALCDGKDILTRYPAINKEGFIYNWSDTHEAIKRSTGGENENSFTTPPLFDCDQLSLRFLRGLNWLRVEPGTPNDEVYLTTGDVLNKKGSRSDKFNVIFKENTGVYAKCEDGDISNHSKNIWQVGMYHASLDIKLQRNWQHCHLSFASKTADEVSSDCYKEGDNLKNYSHYFAGLSTGAEYCPTTNKISKNNYPDGIFTNKDYSEWKTYVNTWNSMSKARIKFAGTTILPTVGGLNKMGEKIDGYKYLRNYPVVRTGGSSSYWWTIYECFRFGKRGPGCYNNRTKCRGPFGIRDGKYSLAHAFSVDDNWRFMTSLPEANKYDDIDEPTSKKSHVKYCDSVGGSIKTWEIDDTLPSPSAANFIPLIKI